MHLLFLESYFIQKLILIIMSYPIFFDRFIMKGLWNNIQKKPPEVIYRKTRFQKFPEIHRETPVEESSL